MASRKRRNRGEPSGGRANRRGGRRAGAKNARGRDGGRERAANGAAGREPARGRDSGRERAEAPPAGHIAIGYTDRAELDRFLEGERGDVVVHGPLHARRDIEAAASLGPGVTEGTPCLVVPLIRERMDEIKREVTEALNRFGGRAARGRGRPRTIRETGGSVRGTSVGAIRLGQGRRAIE
jgi:hypothetical protein